MYTGYRAQGKGSRFCGNLFPCLFALLLASGQGNDTLWALQKGYLPHFPLHLFCEVRQSSKVFLCQDVPLLHLMHKAGTIALSKGEGEGEEQEGEGREQEGEGREQEGEEQEADSIMPCF